MNITHSPIKGIKIIGVIGLGLMGGSLVKAVKAHLPHIKIHAIRDRRRDLRLALRARCIDRVHSSMEGLVAQADMIIIATPIDAVIPVARMIKRCESPRTSKLLVIDIASVKANIADTFQSLTSPYIEFLPTHPMAGSEKIGFQFSAADFFVKRPWIITPHQRTTSRGVRIAQMFIRSLGSTCFSVSPLKHDQYVAFVSHLPFLLATYLFSFISTHQQRALKLAGSGFESMTRLASGSVEMHEEILILNKKNIDVALRDFFHFVRTHPLHARHGSRFFQHAKVKRDLYIKNKQ